MASTNGENSSSTRGTSNHGMELALENLQKKVLDSMDKTIRDYKTRHAEFDQEMEIRNAERLKRAEERAARISALQDSINEYQQLNQMNQNKVDQQQIALTKLNEQNAQLRMENAKAEAKLIKLNEGIQKERQNQAALTNQLLEVKQEKETCCAKILSLEADKTKFENAVKLLDYLFYEENKGKLDIIQMMNAHNETQIENIIQLKAKVQTLENKKELPNKRVRLEKNINKKLQEQINNLESELTEQNERCANLSEKHKLMLGIAAKERKLKDRFKVDTLELKNELKMQNQKYANFEVKNTSEVAKLTESILVLKRANEQLKAENLNLKKSQDKNPTRNNFEQKRKQPTIQSENGQKIHDKQSKKLDKPKEPYCVVLKDFGKIRAGPLVINLEPSLSSLQHNRKRKLSARAELSESFPIQPKIETNIFVKKKKPEPILIDLTSD